MAESEEFLWMGTENSGLIKMLKSDNTLTYYNISNSTMVSNYVRDVTYHNDVLYFSTDSNIYFASDDVITSAFPGIHGQLLSIDANHLGIATDSVYYEWNSFELVPQLNYYDLEGVVETCPGICDRTTDIVRSSNGEIWISHYGFYEYDVIRFNGTEWVVYSSLTDPDILPIESYNLFNKMAIKDNVLLNISWSEFTTFENESWTLAHNSYLNPTIIEGADTLTSFPSAIAYDQTEGYWIGTKYNVFDINYFNLAYYDNSNWHLFQPFDDAVDIQELLPSTFNDNILYIGTNSGLKILDKSCIGVGLMYISLTPEPTRVYPNPSDGHFIIQLSSTIKNDGVLSFFDSEGRIIFNKKVRRGQKQIDIENANLASGTYTFYLNGFTPQIVLIK